MKRKILKLIPYVLLGGVLALPALSEVHDTPIEIKAEESNVVAQIVPTTFSSDGYGTSDFTVGSVTFARSNFGKVSGKLQIKKGTSCGVWTKTVPDNTYISQIKIITKDGNGSKLCVGTSVKPSTSVETYAKADTYTYNYTETDKYTHFSLMSTNNGTPTFAEISVTYSPITGGTIDPDVPPTPPTPSGETYTLVSDKSTLVDGDVIVLGSKANKMVAGAFNTSYLENVGATFGESSVTTDKANEITLSKVTEGWKLFTNEGQLGTAEVKKLKLNEDTTWTIDINEGVAFVEADGFGTIQYNSSSPRFANYTSSQNTIEIYKKSGSVTPVEKFTLTYNANGGTGDMTDSKSPYSKNTMAIVLENAFTAPSGKQFKEWNSQSDGLGTSYKPGNSIQMVADTVLYAIWEDEPQLDGDVYKVVTSPTELNDDDLVLFSSEDCTKVNGAFATKNIPSVDATVNSSGISSENAVPLTIEKEGTGYYLLQNGQYLYEAGGDLKLSKTKPGQTWSIEINSDSTAKVIYTNKIFYNTGSKIFKTYSSTTMSPIKLLRKSGAVKAVKLDATEKDGNVGQTVTISVAKVTGLTPNTYVWSTESNNIEFVGATNTSTVTVQLNEAGDASVTLTVNDEISATCVIHITNVVHDVLEAGNYFITDEENKYLMDSAISCVEDLDFSVNSNMWTFEYAYEGDNTYFIKNSLGSYLSRQQSISGSGQNTRLGLSTSKYDYWTIAGDNVNGYTVKNSSNGSYIAPSDTHDIFRSVANVSKVHLTQGLSFDKIIYEGTLVKSTYNVGEEFDPTGLTFYALFSDGVTKSKITNKITWNKISAGSSVTGKVMFGGIERTVEVTGLTITNYQPESISLSGEYKTQYYVGESVDLSGMIVTLTLKDGEASKNVTLEKDEYDYSPKQIDASTTEVKVFYKENNAIYKTFAITKLEADYVVANHVDAGDRIVIASMDYDAYGIYGGEELDFVNDQPKHAHYNYAPNGLEEFVVEEATGYSFQVQDTTVKGYALKNAQTGKYLKGNNKNFEVSKDTVRECGYDNGTYDFDYYFTYGNYSYYVEFSGGEYNGSTVDNFYGYGCTDYVTYASYTTAYADFRNDGTATLYFETYTIDDEYAEPHSTSVDLFWSYDNGITLTYPNTKPETITDDAVWMVKFDKNNATWSLVNYAHQDLECRYNAQEAGKFGFYGTNLSSYDNIQIYRNNSIAFKNAVNSINVDEESIKTEYLVNDKFQWTSLVVNAYYGGGISSVVPLGGYSITAPDMTTAGEKTVTVSYGTKENTKTDSFVITVSEPAPVKPTPTGIRFTKEPTKNFYVGDEFVYDGEITVTFSDGTERLVTEEEYINVAGASTLVGSRTVTVNVKVDGVTFSLQYTIVVTERPVVKELVGLEASGYKTQFYNDETFEFTGKIYASYKEGTKSYKEEISVASCTFSEFDMSVGTKDITITYVENDVTVTTTITITVIARPVITSIEVTPTTTAYLVGTDFDYSSFSVVATYSDKSTVNLSVSDYNVDLGGFDKDVVGKYTITISLKSDSTIFDTFEVTVANKVIDEIVLQYTSSKEDAKVGDTQQLVLKKPVSTYNGENMEIWKELECTSSDENVATVDENGLVTYHSIGTCTITVSAKNGKGTATYYVSINGNTTKVTLSENEKELYVGETFDLSVAIEGATLDEEPVSFTVSNDVVSYANGVVTANKAGTATITATSLDGKIKDTCVVTVYNHVSGIEITNEETGMKIGSTLTLNYVISPENVKDEAVTWSSSDESVATVNNGVVTALKEGTVTITVTTRDGLKTDSITLTISPIEVSGVSLSENTLNMDIDDTHKLSATVTPNNATNKGVVWSSSNEEVATVDQNGNVTAIGSGNATITVTTVDGNYVASCEVTVNAPVVPPSSSGCGGSLVAVSSIVTLLSFAGVTLLIRKKEK